MRHLAPSAVALRVRVRKTSSSVASRRWTSAASTPARVERADDLDQARRRGATGDRDVRRLGVDRRRRRRTARAPPRRAPSSAASATVTTMRSPPTRALSSAGVPCAATRPWSSTTIVVGEPVGLLEVLGREHERRAVADELAEQRPEVVAALRVEPGGGLVEEQDGRDGDQARGEVEPAAHAAGVGAHQPVGGVGRGRAARAARRRARRASRARQVVEPADQLEVRARGEQAVDRGALAGERRCARAPRPARRPTSKPATSARPAVGGGERGEDADGGRLAGAVVAEQAEHACRPGRRGRRRGAPTGRRTACRGPRRRRRPASFVLCTLVSYIVRQVAVHCTNVKADAATATRRSDLDRPEPGHAAPAPHARADRRGGAGDRRRARASRRSRCAGSPTSSAPGR